MPTTAVQLIDSLERLHILTAEQIDELRRGPASREPKALVRELLECGWLTAYQANLLLQNRGDELVLGSFVLLEKLGEGGMGAVFRARNWKLGRDCAVKLIRKDRLVSPEAVRRFHREIVAAAQLEHPNVVRAYDADEVNGTHFFAMEYVDGVDLARLVREHGPVPPALACEYIRQAALGLQHAHERGLVHRDIKPANLLLARGKGTSTIKILDLGLARHDERSSELSATLTQVGTIMGTPDYMAPEQSVSSHTVDGRADLYGLGCSLYFLLTGSVPFPGGSLTEKLLKHQMEQPRPLETMCDVPAPVADVVYRLMAKKPADRFQTAAALAEHLGALLASGLPKTASVRKPSPVKTGEMHTSVFWADVVAEMRGTPAPQSGEQRGSRRWLLASGVGLAALVMLIFLLVGVLPWQPASVDVGTKPSVAGQLKPIAAVGAIDATFFNGKDLTGWEGDPQVWRVENGEIVGGGIDGGDTAYLRSTQRWRDFQLSFELRVENEEGRFSAFRFKAPDDSIWKGARLQLHNGRMELDSQIVPDARRIAVNPGEYNSVTIRNVGRRLTITVNGQTLADGDCTLAEEGKFGWGVVPESAELRIRNIRFSTPVDPERAAAEALAPHAILTLQLASGDTVNVPQGAPLPPGTVTVISVWGIAKTLDRETLFAHALRLRQLNRIGDWNGHLKWTEGDLARLADAPCAATLTNLQFTPFEATANVVTTLKRFPALRELHIGAAQADDLLLEQLAQDLPKMRILGLHRLRKTGSVTSRGMSAIARLPLTSLDLRGSNLDDALVGELAKCPNLRSLKLSGGTVTATGVMKLSAALPQCRIEWEGRVIEPTTP